MNKKGFTLIELLGVIVILSIIMLIAIPNIASVLEKNKRDVYLGDAKRLITQAEYVLRNNDIEKPTSEQILKIRLSYLGTNDVSSDPDGDSYDLENSYVLVARKNGYLEYYVNLVAKDSDNKYKGISLVNGDELTGKDRLKLIEKNITLPDNSKITSVVGVTANNSSIIVY